MFLFTVMLSVGLSSAALSRFVFPGTATDTQSRRISERFVRASSAIIFPGNTACVAPSGRPGDCRLPEDCKSFQPGGSNVGDGNRIKKRIKPCGFQGRKLKFCCERSTTGKISVKTTIKSAKTPAVSLLPEKCGKGGPTTNSTTVRNIVQGRTAQRDSWPWAVLIGHEKQDGTGIKWECGGTLINSQHVVTAAHCLLPGQSDQMVVRLGEHNLTSDTDGRHQDTHVLRAVRHPRYRSPSKLHDVAVLRLPRPAKLGDNIQPACLPTADAAPLTDRHGWVVGWGQLSPGRGAATATVLQEALVTVQDVAKCEAPYRGIAGHEQRFPGGFGSDVLCALDEDGTFMDSCQGDSGGPLSVKRKQDGRYELVGVVGAGSGCGNPEFAGLYTRVASHVDWILEELGRL